MKTRLQLYLEPDGTVRSVYHDRLLDIGLGAPEVKRLSHVEFNAAEQRWEARLPDTNELICFAETRAECLRLEVEWANQALLANV